MNVSIWDSIAFGNSLPIYYICRTFQVYSSVYNSVIQLPNLVSLLFFSPKRSQKKYMFRSTLTRSVGSFSKAEHKFITKQIYGWADWSLQSRKAIRIQYFLDLMSILVLCIYKRILLVPAHPLTYCNHEHLSSNTQETGVVLFYSSLHCK